MMHLSVFASTKRALVIGIGAYPKESGWAAINGDKDIPMVIKILNTNGFNSKNIKILRNEQATKKQIQASMKQLADMSKPGDQIYIHFSGHGQQVTDVHGDEDDGLDEAWIPYDAQASYAKGKYEGENHILDDELYVWFSAITDKIGDKGHLTISVDACHSGDCSRGGDEDTAVVRGAFADGRKGLETVFACVRSWFSKDETPVVAAERVVKWTMISACMSRQSNHEYNGCGSLTSALYEMADQLGNMTGEEVRVKVRNWMHSKFGNVQKPEINPERKNQSFF